jgi:hypothetical protein
VALLVAFAIRQRDRRIFSEMRPLLGAVLFLAIVTPWYIAAGVTGGQDYAYSVLIQQNFVRALRPWDHIQPWWKYAEYIAGDMMPWTLILPTMVAFHLQGAWSRTLRFGGAKPQKPQAMHRQLPNMCDPMRRFLVLAVLVPVLLLSLSASKQGKYALMIYPFVALLMGSMLCAAANGDGLFASRRLRQTLCWLLAGIFGLVAAVALALSFSDLGGAKFWASLSPYIGPVAFVAAVCAGGASLFAWKAVKGDVRHLARGVGVAVGLVFLVVGTWGFRLLEPHKGYGRWTEEAGPHIAGRQVHFWQTIRSGAMVYTDCLAMPELRRGHQLEELPPGELLVATMRDWASDNGDLTEALRGMFVTLVETPIGGGGFMLLRKKYCNSTNGDSCSQGECHWASDGLSNGGGHGVQRLRRKWSEPPTAGSGMGGAAENFPKM